MLHASWWASKPPPWFLFRAASIDKRLSVGCNKMWSTELFVVDSTSDVSLSIVIHSIEQLAVKNYTCKGTAVGAFGWQMWDASAMPVVHLPSVSAVVQKPTQLKLVPCQLWQPTVAWACNPNGVCVQGLQASVTTLDAELVSIDRQQQCILLSDQTKAQYGLLVLTVGLQPSCSLAAHQLSIDSQQVCSLQDLQHRIPAVSQAKLHAFRSAMPATVWLR